VTVGVLHALYAYKNELPTREELARQACRIEIEILKHPIGKQDQYAASFGGLNLITFLPDDKVIVKSLIIDEAIERVLNQSLMLFYTGIAKNSNQILSEQKDNISQRIEILNEMKNMVQQMKLSLDNGYIDEFGSLFDWGWKLKKQMASEITNEKIDTIYNKAIDAGALGGKITGSGGGGFLLLYCPLEKQDEVREALLDLRELPFRLTKTGSKVIFNTES
jgi:D-glycero-alpha-D-manno-heptose-7-phosphate kinase